MSHYSVMILGDEPEKQLEPYLETDDGPYAVFKEIDADLRKDYENGLMLCFIDLNGKPHPACGNEFYVVGGPAACPAGWAEARVPIKQIYTWESYLSDYCGEMPDEDTGKLGYWENPNAKWDWYEIGGRWTGLLQLKDGSKADQARFEDIDWLTMIAEKAAFWAKIYDYVWPKIKDAPVYEPWDNFFDRAETNEITIEKARELYNAQPCVKIAEELTEIAHKSGDTDVDQWLRWSINSSLYSFSDDRAAFIKSHSEESIRTFALVIKGRWLERGKMGWWAAVSDEKDPETWAAIWDGVIRNTDPKTLVTIVDCHI